MIVYWIMFAIPAILALFESHRDRARISVLWLLAVVALTLLIGFRWQTGGDWGAYDRMVEDDLLNPRPFSLLADPGFTLIIRIAAQSPVGILFVTAASGLMMGVALTRFSLKQPRPWLCLAVAIPYLVVVMGMGYVRQGMAISCLLMGLASLRSGKIRAYSVWVLCGSLFHTTALILLPLGALVTNRNLALRVGLSLTVLLFLYFGLRSARADTLVTNYLDAEMSSTGAAVRLFMTALPSAIFLVFRGRFGLGRIEQGMWVILSCAGILAFLILFVSPSSTVIDRLGLYLLPVQCFVYSRLPQALAASPRNEKIFVLSIIGLYAAAFFVWLNFANNVEYWLPYRLYFLEDAACLRC